MSDKKGKVAVITGAGSGIGRALALGLNERGVRLAISDVDPVGLKETGALVRARGGEPWEELLDVTAREDVESHAAAVAEHFGVIHQIYNNAGIAFTGTIEEMSAGDLERVMNVDFWGVVHGTQAFLPHLIASGDGHVVNLSSAFGLIAVPSQGAYNAAKFAVRGFTEALTMELRAAGHPVQVTCVHPGGVKTNVVRNAGHVAGLDRDDLAESFDRVARMSPDRAAKTILNGVEKGRSRLLVGPDARLIDAMARVLGPRYQPIVQRAMARAGH